MVSFRVACAVSNGRQLLLWLEQSRSTGTELAFFIQYGYSAVA